MSDLNHFFHTIRPFFYLMSKCKFLLIAADIIFGAQCALQAKATPKGLTRLPCVRHWHTGKFIFVPIFKFLTTCCTRPLVEHHKMFFLPIHLIDRLGSHNEANCFLI